MKKIVIAGPDGCGKSTLIKSLAESLKNDGYTVSLNSPWDGIQKQKSFKNKTEIMNYLKDLPDMSRLLFILHGIYLSVDQSFYQKSDYLLIDSYWYKFFLIESTLQKSINLRSYFYDLPVPDKVFYIRTPLQTIARRKPLISSYECGGHPPSREQFISFQSGIHQSWESFYHMQKNWSVLNGSTTPQKLTEQIFREEILNRKGRIHGST